MRNTLQWAIDTAHEIRENYPMFNAWIDPAQDVEKYGYSVWISRQSHAKWFECDPHTFTSVPSYEWFRSSYRVFTGLH